MVEAAGALSSVQSLRQALGQLSQSCQSAADYSGANPSVLQAIRHLLYSQTFAALDESQEFSDIVNPFAHSSPTDVPLTWSLAEAQRQIIERDEQIHCNHIFSQGEPVYSCRDCGYDEASFLCSGCFNASDHVGHDIVFQIHAGGALACCSPDPDAWKPDSSYFTSRFPIATSQDSLPLPNLPVWRQMVDTVLDFCIETWRASSISTDLAVQLAAIVPRTLYCVALWNDEKHSFDAVIDQLCRANPSMSKGLALDAAIRIDTVGREIILLSMDRASLQHVARTISNIDLAVTIVSADSTFCELASSIMVQWLNDLAGLRREENQSGVSGLLSVIAASLIDKAPEQSRFYSLLHNDNVLWKSTRMQVRELLVRSLSLGGEVRRRQAGIFMHAYPLLVNTYLFVDREPEYSILQLSMHLFSTPVIAAYLLSNHSAFPVLVCILYSFFTEQLDTTGKHLNLPPDFAITRISPDSSSFKHKRYAYLFSDMKRLLSSPAALVYLCSNPQAFGLFCAFANLFSAMNPIARAATEHVEFEADTWVTAFNMTMHLAKACRAVGEAFRYCTEQVQIEEGLRTVIEVGKARHEEHLVSFGGRSFRCVRHCVRTDPVSFHHPVTWLLAEMMKNSHIFRLPDEESSQKKQTAHLSELSDAQSLLHTIEDAVTTSALVAQIRAGLWVRNGFSVRAQQLHYREYSLRESTYDQDVFLLQIGLHRFPEELLIAVLDRFEFVDLLDSAATEHAHYDIQQTQIMLEEMLLLLVHLCTEPANLLHWDLERRIRRDIIHCLALGSCSHSELVKRVADNSSESPLFDRVLAQVSAFRAPQGAFDHGVYSIRPAALDEINPYYFRYSRNQRDEVTAVIKESGRFQDMSRWIESASERPSDGCLRSSVDHIFDCAVLHQLLLSALRYQSAQSELAEPLLDVTLHLALLAIPASPDDQHPSESVCTLCKSLQEYLAILRRKITAGHLLIKLDVCLKRCRDWERDVLVDAGVLSTSEVEASGKVNADDQRAKRLAAKARQDAVLANFAKARATFVDNHPLDFDDDSEDGDADMTAVDNSTESFGTCIVCQEALNRSESFGSLAFIQSSSALRCVGTSDVVTVKQVLSSNQTGEPSQTSHAISSSKGLYLSTCGHSMHLKCFQTYVHSVEARHAAQPTRNHPEDLGRREFICPLCKSLGNVLVPKSPSLNIASRTSTISDGDIMLNLEKWAAKPPIAELSGRTADLLQAFTRADNGQLRAFKADEALPSASRAASDDLSPQDLFMLRRILQVVWPLSIEAHRSTIESIDSHSAYLPKELVAYTIATIETQTRRSPLTTSSDFGEGRSASVVRDMLHLLRLVAGLGSESSSTRCSELGALVSARLTISTSLRHASYLRLPVLQREPLELLVELSAFLPSAFDQHLILTFYMQLLQIILQLPRVQDLKSFTLLQQEEPDVLQRACECVGLFALEVTEPFSNHSVFAATRLARPSIVGKVVCTLAVPFLRRAQLLMQSLGRNSALERAPFSAAIAPYAEFHLLVTELGIPHPEVCLHPVTSSIESFNARLRFWIKSFIEFSNDKTQLPLELPSRQGLIQLPLGLDAVIEKAAKTICPSCKTVPVDPAVCLLCGRIVCNQSYCCMDRDLESEPELGECNLHMLSCGGSSGLFLLVKKSCVLALYANKGCILSSPYLDPHGEIDIGCRRHRLQHLQDQRYQELNLMWTKQSIPTIVARKLEAGVDSGGWQTM